MALNAEELQLVVFREDVVEPQNQQKVPSEQNQNMLSLRRSSLTQVPDHVLDRGLLTYLCLEGNWICSVSGPLFLILPRLQWLDLRNNRILSLPAELGSHRSLETLLIGGNPVSELPAELGNISSFRGLEFRDCPITFPPQEVMQQGCKAVLRYLRRVLSERLVFSTKTSAAARVEKLNLAELMESEDETKDRNELQMFQELRDQLVSLDQTSQEAKDQKHRLPSVPRRKKASAKAGTSPACQDWRAAGMFQETQKELRDRRAQLEQSRKGHKTLPKERALSRRTMAKNGSESKKKRPERLGPPEEDQEDTRTYSQVQICGLNTGSDDDRSARKLQRHIRTCVEKIQENCRHLRGSVSEKEDVEEVRRSQAQLLEGHIFRKTFRELFHRLHS